MCPHTPCASRNNEFVCVPILPPILPVTAGIATVRNQRRSRLLIDCFASRNNGFVCVPILPPCPILPPHTPTILLFHEFVCVPILILVCVPILPPYSYSQQWVCVCPHTLPILLLNPPIEKGIALSSRNYRIKLTKANHKGERTSRETLS